MKNIYIFNFTLQNKKLLIQTLPACLAYCSFNSIRTTFDTSTLVAQLCH